MASLKQSVALWGTKGERIVVELYSDGSARAFVLGKRDAIKMAFDVHAADIHNFAKSLHAGTIYGTGIGTSPGYAQLVEGGH